MAEREKPKTKKPLVKKKPEKEKGIVFVRGGAICDITDRSAKIIRGRDRHPAVCRTTPGPDPRPRYRAAGTLGQ